MTAHKKKDSRKKAPQDQSGVPRSAASEQHGADKLQSPEAIEYAGPRQKKLQRRAAAQNAAAPSETVRKSTLYLCCAVFLLLGVLLGSLLPAMRPSDTAQPQAQQAQTPASSEQTDRHIQEMEQAVQKNPQDVSTWIQLGNHYFDTNKARDAVRAYSRALELKPDNPDVMTDMGIMHRHLNEFDRAVECFTRASAMNPRHEQSRFNLGVVLFFDLNRKEDARRTWRELLAVNPEALTPDGKPVRKLLEDLK